MINKIVIACCDDEIKGIMKKYCSSVLGENHVMVCESLNEMHNEIKYEDVAIIFDKYFLGFVVSYELVRIRYLNDKALTYFVDMGDVAHYFAMRVHQLGVDGFIPMIEDKEYLKKSIQKIQIGIKTYPESVQRCFDEEDYLLDREFISEVTTSEMAIALYISKGCTTKEICYYTGLSKSSVCNYTKRLKRKIGYNKPGDLELLSRRYFKHLSGGENGN